MYSGDLLPPHAAFRRIIQFAFLLSAASIALGQSTNELERLKADCKYLLMEKGDVAGAKPVADQLLVRALRQHGELHQETVEALHFVGFVAAYSGDRTAAALAWNRSIRIQESFVSPDPVWLSRTLHMLADLHRNQNEFEVAETFMKRALDVREKALGSDHPEMAQLWKTLGFIRETSGDCADAELFFLRALTLTEKAGSDYEHLAALVLSALSSMYGDLRDWEKASHYAKRALQLDSNRLGAEHPFTADRMERLAHILYGQDDFVGAESLHLESLSIHTKVYGSKDLRLFDPLLGLGRIYLSKGQLDQAEAFLRRSLTIVSDKLGEKELKRVQPLEHLAAIHERRGDYANAQELIEQSLHLRERHLGSAHPYTCGDVQRLALLHFAQGRPGAALAAVKRIQDGEEKGLADVLAFTSERQRLAYHGGDLLNERARLWATMGHAPAVARALIRTKGVVLDSLLEDRLLTEGSEDAETQRLVADMTRTKQRLAALHLDLLREAGDSVTLTGETNELQSLRQRFDTLEASLARKVTGLGRARRALSARVEDVSAAIPERTALVEFVRYGHYQGRGKWQDSYGALLLARRDAPKWFPLGPAEPIEKNVKLYQHAVRSRATGEPLEAILRTLHRKLWQPLEASLQAETERVIICPDGQLNFLSFATLLTESNRFLGEQWLVSYVSSSRDLLVETKLPPVGAQLLVWANPDFGAAPTELSGGDAHQLTNRAGDMRGLRDLSFRPLPGAEKEGRALSLQALELGFSEAILRVGKDASESELSRISSPDVLHLATHGFVLPEMESLLATSLAGPGDRIATPAAALTNPMLRCGLALAGARRTLDAWAKGEPVPVENDGIVTAEEIAALDLRHTRLAVLSACDTGLGEARAGEGVLGLRRGFSQAGAQNLLLTLWPIDDEKSAGFMAEFYAEAHRCGSFPQALAQAQRTWLTKLREKDGVAEACKLAGAYILSFQGRATLESSPSSGK